MAATVRLSYWSGAGPTASTAETGALYNQEESLAGTGAPIPRPTATGTEFSWHKVFALEVTAGDSTSISNRRLNYNGSAPATGLGLFYKDDADTYTRSTAEADTATGSNGSTPTGYSAMPSSPTSYDAGVDSASSTGRSGDYFRTALGVSNNYSGGAGSSIALPDLDVTYDES